MSDTKWIFRPIKWVVMPEDESIFSEQATLVEIVDEAAGEFVSVRQDRSDGSDGDVGLLINDLGEHEYISGAIVDAFEEIERHKIKENNDEKTEIKT